MRSKPGTTETSCGKHLRSRPQSVVVSRSPKLWFIVPAGQFAQEEIGFAQAPFGMLGRLLQDQTLSLPREAVVGILEPGRRRAITESERDRLRTRVDFCD